MTECPRCGSECVWIPPDEEGEPPNWREVDGYWWCEECEHEVEE